MPYPTYEKLAPSSCREMRFIRQDVQAHREVAWVVVTAGRGRRIGARCRASGGQLDLVFVSLVWNGLMQTQPLSARTPQLYSLISTTPFFLFTNTH